MISNNLLDRMQCSVFLRHDVLISYCAKNMGPWVESTEAYSFTCPVDSKRNKLKIYKTQGRERGRCVNCSKKCSIYDIASAHLGMDKVKDFRMIVEHISNEVNIPLHKAYWNESEIDSRSAKPCDQHRQAQLPYKKHEELICAVQRTADTPEQQKAIDQELPFSHSSQVPATFMPPFYCREQMNHGNEETSQEFLSNEIQCCFLEGDAMQSKLNMSNASECAVSPASFYPVQTAMRGRKVCCRLC